ncbi:non-hydrolyzing UDP-N-acetylglucosamine 2-epimerase [Flammeovirga kamogawensis]|uniref:UDP-N-acetylglucosamine 2-epimerase (Non-hydrolyzing) n=1 Tax=Flammeovirga kamogawensis TaxID=373891 RepID=A0ABX8GSN4_9BACT|nr:UDP-N-acetylglucosamine 2-epimerase (non-hydrolyzing) [Flammeovirga kamogawensis]MBB6461528.1 UDP-GlcNAc3NAcA epimerase [Flammeovirga kamogawensis]QWG06419.1 UDP-N-acetylglucosamine 2-epimerase (non-hydrolyzing) [Flammeovirga kamogawensis]TRX68248.1 UDP-N-acetylglucosamine 2-epimerase (non-hydrolyzing) [Flammeovirga kamogawensis]
MKILTIIGARPQFIKAATVSRVIKKIENCTEILVHTGQHYDENMSDIFFDELGIPRPDYNLGVGGGSHGAQTGEMLAKIEKVLFKEKPDYLLVYGDTNSTLAGALAASKMHIPVVHVEAGLRSFNMKMPEEQNRILTDHISTLLFTPTDTGYSNLLKEGINDSSIYNIGDVMYDAAMYYGKKAQNNTNILEKLNVKYKDFILATIHRAENTDNIERLTMIFDELSNVAKTKKVILPLHPRTKKSLENINFNFSESKISFIDPVGYIEMVMLEMSSKLILTDSGGVQKEAFFHKVPCITLRDETEWVELVEAGFNFLAKDLKSLETLIGEVLSKSFDYDKYSFYGKANAANKVIDFLKVNK